MPNGTARSTPRPSPLGDECLGIIISFAGDDDRRVGHNSRGINYGHFEDLRRLPAPLTLVSRLWRKGQTAAPLQSDMRIGAAAMPVGRLQLRKLCSSYPERPNPAINPASKVPVFTA